MDIATVLGILSALGLLGVAIVSQGDFTIFVNINAFLIVLGGTMGATFINFPIRDIVSVFRVVKKAFFYTEEDPLLLIPEMISYSKLARKDGLLALEKVIDQQEDPFFKEGLTLVVDGTPQELLNHILRNDIDYLAQRHNTGVSIFRAMGQYAPAFGMIGTLIGLIFMLKSLNDVTQIAGAMAVALVTTFYGAIMSNIIFMPIAGKLQQRTKKEILKKEMILTGILAIQSGDIPGIVEQKMISFLPGEYRNIYYQEREV